MPNYETKQAILEEAGLLHNSVGETLNGSANNSNKIFTTNKTPICDRNDDDEVDTEDVTVYVNGAAVSIAVVVADTGSVTLQSAPASNAVVTIDYSYSAVRDSYLEKIRDEAEQWVDEGMRGIDPTPYTSDPIPATIRRLTRQYAAAQLLIKDYGSNQDTTGTSKDGYARLKAVQAALDKYVAIGGSTGLPDAATGDVSVVAEADLFDIYDPSTGVSVDDFFMRDIRTDGEL